MPRKKKNARRIKHRRPIVIFLDKRKIKPDFVSPGRLVCAAECNNIGL